MRAEDMLRQVDAFVGLYEREGGPWEDLFRRWADGKAFRAADEWALRMMVRAELVARGDLTPDDTDWFNEEAA